MYSDEAKLRVLHKKIKANFLQPVKVNIEFEMAETPMGSAVVSKFPPNNDINRRTRRVSKQNRGRSGQPGRGRGGRGTNGGRDGRRDRGTGKRGRNDAYFIQGNDGNRMEVHPSYRFTTEQ